MPDYQTSKMIYALWEHQLESEVKKVWNSNLPQKDGLWSKSAILQVMTPNVFPRLAAIKINRETVWETKIEKIDVVSLVANILGEY